MATTAEIYTKFVKDIAQDYNFSQIILDHNESQNLSEDDAEYTFPMDNDRSFGSIKEVTKTGKSGYGGMITVVSKGKRDDVLGKLWSAIKDDSEELAQKLKLELLKEGLMYEVSEFIFGPQTVYSTGSKTIYCEIQELKKDGTPKSTPVRIVFFAKGLKNVSGDPHELMTGTLIAMSKIIDVSPINRLPVQDRGNALHNLTKEIFDNYTTVDGYNSKDAAVIEGDLKNLAKAISVSNYVVKLITKNGGRINKVYQTGKAWSKDIKQFEGSNEAIDQVIKAYNSSDLIVRFSIGTSEHFWGLSLKKKGIGLREADPTLLNKPVVGEASDSGKKRAGYLYLRANRSQVRLLDQREDQFWKEVYKAKYQSEPSGDWKKKLDTELSDDEKNAALTGKSHRVKGRLIEYPPNIFFEAIHDVFLDVMQDRENFKEFLDLSFRVNIDSYVNKQNYHFSLITGSGDLKSDGRIQINYPDEKPSVFIHEVFNSMYAGGPAKLLNAQKAFSQPRFEVIKTRGKIHAFERGATAAKLFYTMKIQGLPLVNIEVRYKGAITASPQFQVFITTNLKRYLNAAKQKLKNKGIHAILTQPA